nr:immunoglobulin heavy chain junction region [Mus musculus]MBK4189882.1 immunoglobulin heavy chain junction region [Mus musculus]MBK4189883.1 immunoglobulin heavy chain junction region [Mus musculus]
CARDWDWFAYW